MKKILIGVLSTAFIIASLPVYAQETVTVIEQPVDVSTVGDTDLISYVNLFQDVTLELAEDEKERLQLLLSFVSRSNDRLATLLSEEHYEEAVIYLNKYNEDIESAEKLYTEVTSKTEDSQTEEEELQLEKIEEDIIEKTSMRGVNLQLLLTRENLPETARTGVEKALANQEKAKLKHPLAQERKEQRTRAKQVEKEAKKDEKQGKKDQPDLDINATEKHLNQEQPEKAKKVKEPKATGLERANEVRNENSKQNNEKAGK
ncbi:hypothetical protein [Bacillus solitudinis]|uniref:hypothetical protein n=1 Tax=Bacillus solitudinis TaxID=2014074 RepID=UPI000C23E3E6|nr:hypothetical protein [Bacillus solitudinis]